MSDKSKTAWEAAVVLVDLAWAEEADRRFQAYKRGEMKTVRMDEIRKMLQPDERPYTHAA